MMDSSFHISWANSHLKQTQRRELREPQGTLSFRIQTVNMQREQPGLSDDSQHTMEAPVHVSWVSVFIS